MSAVLQHIPQHPGVAQGIRLYLKREDLVHPVVQGNKWHKLRLVIEHLQRTGYRGLLTFGGPFSNHLHATAAAGHLFGFPTAGIVRGMAADKGNPALSDAAQWGMRLHLVRKATYDQKTDAGDIQAILQLYPDYFVLNEGGNHPLAIAGCRAIGEAIASVFPDKSKLYVCVPAGTGVTAAGIAAGLAGEGSVLLFPAAPYGVDAATVAALHAEAGISLTGADVRYLHDYHFGAFAARHEGLLQFVHAFRAANDTLLDPIYTAKMLYGIFDLMTKGYFPRDSTVVAVHTGGLQGWRSGIWGDMVQGHDVK